MHRKRVNVALLVRGHDNVSELNFKVYTTVTSLPVKCVFIQLAHCVV